jgi:hypothetical protein
MEIDLSSFMDIDKKELVIASVLEIDAKQLKTAFFEIQTLLKKSVYTKLVEFAILEKKLIVSSATSMVYRKHIDITGGNYSDFKVNCLFTDLFELLPGRGKLVLTVTGEFVRICGEEIDTALNAANSELTSVPDVSGEYSVVNVSVVRDSIKKMLSMTAPLNAFKKGGEVYLFDDHMQLRYETIMVQLPSSGIRAVLSNSDAVMVEKFLYNATSAKLYQRNDYMCLAREDAFLYIPEQRSFSIDRLEEYLKQCLFICEVDCATLRPRLQSLLKAIGKCDCTITLYKEGIEVESHSNSSSAKVMIGNTKHEVSIMKFVLRLEFLLNVVNIIGSRARFYRKDDILCVEGLQALSVLSLR